MYILRIRKKLINCRGSAVTDIAVALLIITALAIIIGQYIRITEISASVKDAMTQAVLRLEGQNEYETHNRREGTTLESQKLSLDYVHRELERTLGIDASGEKAGEYKISNLKLTTRTGDLFSGDDRLYTQLSADVYVYVNIFTNYTIKTNASVTAKKLSIYTRD